MKHSLAFLVKYMFMNDSDTILKFYSAAKASERSP